MTIYCQLGGSQDVLCDFNLFIYNKLYNVKKAFKNIIMEVYFEHKWTNTTFPKSTRDIIFRSTEMV